MSRKFTETAILDKIQKSQNCRQQQYLTNNTISPQLNANYISSYKMFEFCIGKDMRGYIERYMKKGLGKQTKIKFVLYLDFAYNIALIHDYNPNRVRF